MAMPGVMIWKSVGDPVCNQSRGSRRHTNKSSLAPYNHAAADVVDELVHLDTVLCPFRVEYSLFCRADFLSRMCDRDKIGTDAAIDDFLVRDPFVIEPEMLGRLVERRVDDRIFDDDLTHTLSCRAERADAQAIRSDLFTSNLLCDSDLRDFQRNNAEFWSKPFQLSR
jgi:hypothetical protein